MLDRLAGAFLWTKGNVEMFNKIWSWSKIAEQRDEISSLKSEINALGTELKIAKMKPSGPSFYEVAKPVEVATKHETMIIRELRDKLQPVLKDHLSDVLFGELLNQAKGKDRRAPAQMYMSQQDVAYFRYEFIIPETRVSFLVFDDSHYYVGGN
jgi:hypothetical protein